MWHNLGKIQSFASTLTGFSTYWLHRSTIIIYQCTLGNLNKGQKLKRYSHSDFNYQLCKAIPRENRQNDACIDKETRHNCVISQRIHPKLVYYMIWIQEFNGEQPITSVGPSLEQCDEKSNAYNGGTWTHQTRLQNIHRSLVYDPIPTTKSTTDVPPMMSIIYASRSKVESLCNGWSPMPNNELTSHHRAASTKMTSGTHAQISW